ncbi:MAG: hypothetical protein JWP48_6919 [Actinoallomurus sp.]|jgi:hypothetical protein|nr:hypothetical protein [Actinoallomurus sp.]
MGIDHTNDGADENVERATPADRGSPLPRDRPGADAYPSRADGRDGAAAANDTQNNGGRSEEKPGAGEASQEGAERNDSVATGNDYEASGESNLKTTESVRVKETGFGEKYNDGRSMPNTAAVTSKTDDPLVPQSASDRAGEEATETTPVIGVGEQAGSNDDTNESAAHPAAEDRSRITAADGAEEPDRGSRDRSGEADIGEDTGAGDDAPAESQGVLEKSTLSERLLVEGKSLREHLDPIGAAAWSKEIGDKVPDPTDRLGNRIADISNDKQSRRERMRKEGWRASEDTVDFTQKRLSDNQAIFSPPTGHAVARSSPELTTLSHEGASIVDTATALMAAGIVLGELYRQGHKRLSHRKAHDDGSDR